jgi:hypothetical protein
MFHRETGRRKVCLVEEQSGNKVGPRGREQSRNQKPAQEEGGNWSQIIASGSDIHPDTPL